MNKFNIPNPTGGYKLTRRDLNFIYDALKEGMSGAAYGLRNAILFGCRLTNGADNASSTSTYSEGFVAINGEIYYFPGQTWNNSTITDACFVPVETVISPSPKTSIDASVKNVHFQRRVQIQQYAAQTVKFRHKELFDYGDNWKTVINPGGITTVYDTVYNASTDWLGFSDSDFETLKFRKNGPYLELKGLCRCETWADTETLFTLPNWAENISFRPLKGSVLVVPARSGTTYPTYFMNVTILPNGNVVEKTGTFSSAGDPLTLMFDHRILLF